MLRSMVRVCGLLAVVTLLMSGRVSAAADGGAKLYVADDVLAVVSIDLTKVDVPAAIDMMVQFGAIPDAQAAQARDKASLVQRVFSELPKAGARRAFALLRTSDVQARGTSWIVETGSDAEAAKVSDWLKQWTATAGSNKDFAEFAQGMPTKFEVVGDAVLGAGSIEQLAMLKASRRSTPRADALSALDALAKADVGIIAIGDVDSRRVVREMFPALPAPFTEIDGRLLADGIAWAAVTAKLPPEPTIGVTIEAATPAVAKTLEESATKGLEFLKGVCLAAAMNNSPEAVGALPVLALLKPQVDGTRLTLTLGDDKAEITAIHSLLIPALSKARESAARSQRMNNLKYLALAMFNYHDAKGSFPPAAIYDAHGKPLLSWRVALLPYLEHQGDMKALYQEFHLDEPWDSEHNRPLIAKMPKVFASSGELAASGRTTLVVPMGEATAFHGVEGTKVSEIKDGTSITILIVEAVPERAVVWTKPEDWEVDLKDPLRGVKQGDDAAGGVFAAAFCDGHVEILNDDIDPKKLAAMLTIVGGEDVSP